jgi:hypothetical protein
VVLPSINTSIAEPSFFSSACLHDAHEIPG